MARGYTALIGLVVVLYGCDSGGNKTGTAGTSGGAGHGGITGGGGTGGTEAFCTQACEKIGTCRADAGIPVQDIVDSCKTACHTNVNPPGSVICTNESEIVAASEACLQRSCAEIQTCLDDVPACHAGVGGSGGGAAGAAGTGGRGGSPGAGGVPGTGGSGATGWSCLEYTTGCVCAMSSNPGPGCTAVFSCCYTTGSGQGQTCTCLKALDAPTCAATIPATGSQIVAHCPPP